MDTIHQPSDSFRTPCNLDLTDSEIDLIGDALGLLWHQSSSRQAEIRNLCMATGLTVTVDL